MEAPAAPELCEEDCTKEFLETYCTRFSGSYWYMAGGIGEGTYWKRVLHRPVTESPLGQEVM